MTYRVVLDTNVLFEGLTKQETACGLIVDAWFANLITVCVSTALAYEYRDVLFRKLSTPKWEQSRLVLNKLLHQAEFVPIYYSWRPASPDPSDDLVVDCVMNANALLVTANQRDFRQPSQELGILVFTPVEFVTKLSQA
jgi:putative PIN family toxin of toxin-antitoxin system